MLTAGRPNATEFKLVTHFLRHGPIMYAVTIIIILSCTGSINEPSATLINSMWWWCDLFQITNYSLYLKQLEEDWIISEDLNYIVVLWGGGFSPFVAQRPAWRNHCSQGIQLSDINKDSFGETKKSHSEIALKFKIKRCSNIICYICQRFMTSAKWLQSKSVTVYCCYRSSLFSLGWISSAHIDKVLAWLSFRKIYVLKASATNYWHKFPSNCKLAQWILRHTFPSQYILSRFWNANFPFPIWALPKITPSKRAFEKYKSRGLFSEFYSIFQKVKSFIGKPSTVWIKNKKAIVKKDK